jgi:hypothetical protein
MKIKTSELAGASLNWAVAKCEGGVNIDASGLPWLPDESPNEYGEAVWFKPSTNWAQGGPIIERERIEIASYGDQWQAVAHLESESIYERGETPLIAAMRCYVASKLGDEVEIPQELLGEVT